MTRHANVAVFVPHAGCAHACSFCNQRAISGTQRLPRPEEVTALLEHARCSLGENTQAQIAFFGGSFTAINRQTMVALLAAAYPFVESGVFAGIRISTRPDCIDGDVLRTLAAYRVTDIELGVQSMDDRVLAANRRGHTAAQVVAAARQIRAHGFGLGVQMMTGLYADTPQRTLYTARALAALRPDTVRIYPALTLEGTELAALWRAGVYRPAPLEETVALCARLLAFFTRCGIRVIRLGLHDSEGLAGSVLAGAHHPALRELCESQVLLNRARRQLRAVPPGPVTVCVHPRGISKMTGQHRANLRALEADGYRPVVCADEALGYLQVRVR